MAPLKRLWPFILLGTLLLGLQAKLWLGDGGLRQARKLEEKVRIQANDNVHLQQRNDSLAAEVEDLKSGEAAAEERARNELGMIKPNETFYRVVDPDTVRIPNETQGGEELK